MPVRKKAKVPNAHESTGEYMQEKAAQELIGGKGHPPFLIAVCVILPAEGQLRKQREIGEIGKDGSNCS